MDETTIELQLIQLKSISNSLSEFNNELYNKAKDKYFKKFKQEIDICDNDTEKAAICLGISVAHLESAMYLQNN